MIQLKSQDRNGDWHMTAMTRTEAIDRAASYVEENPAVAIAVARSFDGSYTLWTHNQFDDPKDVLKRFRDTKALPHLVLVVGGNDLFDDFPTRGDA